MMIEISITYPIEYYPEYDKKIMEIIGIDKYGYDSGMGMGERNMWVDINRHEFKRIKKELRELNPSIIMYEVTYE